MKPLPRSCPQSLRPLSNLQPAGALPGFTEGVLVPAPLRLLDPLFGSRCQVPGKGGAGWLGLKDVGTQAGGGGGAHTPEQICTVSRASAGRPARLSPSARAGVPCGCAGVAPSPASVPGPRLLHPTPRQPLMVSAAPKPSSSIRSSARVSRQLTWPEGRSWARGMGRTLAAAPGGLQGGGWGAHG